MDFTLGSRSAKKQVSHDIYANRLPPPSVSTIRWGAVSSEQQQATQPQQQQKFTAFGPESILPTPTRSRTASSSLAGIPSAQSIQGHHVGLADRSSDGPPPTSLYDFDVTSTPDRRIYTYPSVACARPNHPPAIASPGADVLMTTPAQRTSTATSSAAALLDNPDGGSTWVTVFGFPTGSSQSVVSYFKGLGQIMNFEEGRGNWVHIEFASSMIVLRALSRNGTFLPGSNCMIGVVSFAAAQSALNQAASNSFLSPIKQQHDGEFKKPLARPALRAPAASLQTPLKGSQYPSHQQQYHHSSVKQSSVPIYADGSLPFKSSLTWSQKIFRFIFGW